IIFKEEKDSIEMIYSTGNKEERFSISDDKHKNIFSVRITAVTPDDGGVYLCGVWINRQSYSYSVINSVLLHAVTKVGVSRVSGYSGGGLMIKCEHPQYKTKPKYICKESDGCSERKNPGVQDEWMENGDVSLYDDTRAGVLMVFFRELKAADAGTYRCGVNVSHYTESFTELQLNVKHVIISNVSVRDAGVYWCGAETRDTYLTFISLNTKIQLNFTSDAFTLTVWKLRHKMQVQMNSNDDQPTIPSDGLLYAAVTFQKREESLSDATVRFSKDEIQSDYTMISHNMRLN
ncbi:hypothetical protein M9458_053289, partial [Cirrhinus mrigala]